MDEEEGLGAGEDVVGGPLERVLAAPVAVDGHGRRLPRARRRAAVVAALGRQAPHRGGHGGRLLAPGVMALGLRHDRRVVERDERHLLSPGECGGGGQRRAGRGVVVERLRREDWGGEGASLAGNASPVPSVGLGRVVCQGGHSSWARRAGPSQLGPSSIFFEPSRAHENGPRNFRAEPSW